MQAGARQTEERLSVESYGELDVVGGQLLCEEGLGPRLAVILLLAWVSGRCEFLQRGGSCDWEADSQCRACCFAHIVYRLDELRHILFVFACKRRKRERLRKLEVQKKTTRVIQRDTVLGTTTTYLQLVQPVLTFGLLVRARFGFRSSS